MFYFHNIAILCFLKVKHDQTYVEQRFLQNSDMLLLDNIQELSVVSKRIIKVQLLTTLCSNYFIIIEVLWRFMAKYHFYLEGQKKAFREKDDSQKVILNAEIKEIQE